MLSPSESMIEARRQMFEQVQAGALTHEQMFQQALEMDAYDATALTALAQYRTDADDLAAAEQYCWRAMEADPCRHEPWLTLCKVLTKRSADQALLNGIMELGARKALRSQEAVEDFEKRTKSRPGMENLPALTVLEATAEVLLLQRDDEPDEVAERLAPHRLVDELLDAAIEGLDSDLVDAIVELGPRCVPHLIGVLRALATGTLPDDDPSAPVASVALIGEIGDLAALPELLECAMMDDEGMQDAACWAVERIAERKPEETMDALRKLAADRNVPQRRGGRAAR